MTKTTIISVHENTGGTQGPLKFQCCLNSFGLPPNCGRHPRCQEHTNGSRCENRSGHDIDLCDDHLKQHKLIIKPSGIQNAGLGLFAASTGRNVRKPCFKKGDLIREFSGRVLKKSDLSYLYDVVSRRGRRNSTLVNVATYAHTIGRVIRDSACLRTAADYSNHANDQEANAEAREDGLYALKNIMNGQEILWNYGEDYWRDSEHSIELSSDETDSMDSVPEEPPAGAYSLNQEPIFSKLILYKPNGVNTKTSSRSRIFS